MEFNKYRQKLSNLANLKYNSKTLQRLKKDNQLNRRISAVLNSFYDLETIAIRLKRNIALVQVVERNIQLRNKKEDKDVISSIGQKLRKEAECINRENFLDLKILHVVVKIFLDDFTELLRFIFSWRDIGDRSITKFYNSLKKYSGTDDNVILFKKNNFDIIEKIINSIVDYRDNGVVHNQQKHKQTIWSINDMRGNIKQVAVLSPGVENSSLNQNDLFKLLFNYLDSSISFIEDKFQVKHNS